MANLIEKLASGRDKIRRLSAVVDSFLSAATEADARDAIGAAAAGAEPYYVGEASQTSLPITLTNGIWADSRGLKWTAPVGSSVGPVGSGADFESADFERIYLAMWPHLALASPGYSITGGAGASAQADWDAGKPFFFPDYRGRTPVQIGQGGGLTNRLLAGVWGEEEHTQLETEMAQHFHSASSSTTGNHAHGLLSGSFLGTDGYFANEISGLAVGTGFGWTGRGNSGTNTVGNHAHVIYIGNAGGGLPFNVTQPSYGINLLWFLGEAT